MKRAMPMEETLQQMADMAMFMEDTMPDVMCGRHGYSVNLNFRKDGGCLFVSVEAYGNKKHISRSRQFPMEDLRRDRRNRKAIMSAALVTVLAIIVIMLVAR